jgi:hypothetical protein
MPRQADLRNKLKGCLNELADSFNSCGEFDKAYILEIFGEEKKNALFKVLGFPSKKNWCSISRSVIL